MARVKIVGSSYVGVVVDVVVVLRVGCGVAGESLQQ